MDKNDFKNEKDYERFEKLKAEVGLKQLDYEKLKKVTKRRDKLTNLIETIITMIIVFICILGMLFLIIFSENLKNRYAPDKEYIISNLEDMYGEKFKIIEENEKYYTLVPKKNKKLKFTQYIIGNNTKEDYMNQVTKYFYENILDENLKKDILIDMKKNEENENFLDNYKMYIEVKDFNQIEEAVKTMWKIRKIALEQNKRVYDWITAHSLIRNNKYYSNVNYSNSEDTLEDLIKKEKYYYIKYLQENNLNLTEVPQEELEKYKPESLEIIVNNKKLSEIVKSNKEIPESFFDAIYNINLNEYEVNLNIIITALKDAKVKYNLNGGVESFEYKNQKFKFRFIDNEERKGELPINCRTSYLEKYFDAKIKYNFENEKIYIEI